VEIWALIPLLTFAIPYLASRQIVSAAVMRLTDQERLALFPIGRMRQWLTWLLLPLIVAVYLSSTPLALRLSMASAAAYIVALELYQLVQVRRLSVAPEFKRKYLMATALACAGVLFAAGALWFFVYAP
jgi:hypothetical protein